MYNYDKMRAFNNAIDVENVFVECARYIAPELRNTIESLLHEMLCVSRNECVCRVMRAIPDRTSNVNENVTCYCCDRITTHNAMRFVDDHTFDYVCDARDIVHVMYAKKEVVDSGGMIVVCFDCVAQTITTM